MNIDTERLKTDAAYWDEVAPEGAVYFDRESELFFNDQGYWPVIGPLKVSYSQNRCASRFIGRPRYGIPRPTKPAAPDWDGEGLPPVGCECEVSYAGYWVKATAVHVTVIGHVVFEMHGNYAGSVRVVDRAELVRTIRTKEQRDRDDLAEVLANAFDATYEDCQEAADAAISAGWTKP